MNTSTTALQSQAEIVQLGCLSDNYCSLIHEPVSGQTVVIDTPDSGEITKQLNVRNWHLSHILTTHHHWDHIDGHLALKERYNCCVIGPKANEDVVPGIDRSVEHGDKIQVGELTLSVMETPGHTLGHVVYWEPTLQAVFVGDTLFSMGCGRLFEGTAKQMWQSIQQLKELPAETYVYCGHEYTQANAHFALTLEPGNVALQQRVVEVDQLRAAGQPTIPTTIQRELQTNPFMRADQLEIQLLLQMQGCSEEQVFAEIRHRKDKA